MSGLNRSLCGNLTVKCRYDLAEVRDTDVVSCQKPSFPKGRQHAWPPLRDTARFLVIRGRALKEFLCNQATLDFPLSNWMPSSEWELPQKAVLEFRPSGRKKSLRDEATETKLDVVKIQIVDCVEPDDPEKPVQGNVLWESDVQSVCRPGL
jgi:hypothetical protein